MNEDGPNKWEQAVIALENIRRGSGLPPWSPDSSYLNSILNYRDIHSSGYILNVGWDPKNQVVYKAGLEALLFGGLQAHRHSLHIVLLHDFSPKSVLASSNDWQDLLPFVLKSLGMRPLPNVRWCDRRQETGKFHLICDNITFAAVPTGIIVRGYAILGDIFSTTGIQPLMVMPTEQIFHSNGGDLTLNFGPEGIFQVDAISGCAAGLHHHAKR